MKLLTGILLLISTILCNNIIVVNSESQPANPLLSYEVLFNWKELDFDFGSDPTARGKWLESNKFIKENNAVSGIKVSENKVFLTVPRLRPGVPATLVSLPYNPNGSAPAYKEVTNGPKLSPYPSWGMNRLGNCSAFQSSSSMEIDQFNRMWVIDSGRVDILEKKESSSSNECPPKLVLIDLKTDGILRTFEFPEDVVGRKTNVLSDIAVGCKSMEDCWAYISDAGDAKIVVYSMASNKAWAVQHSSMRADPNALTLTIDGQNVKFNSSVSGLALSPLDTGFSTLFYSPMSSLQLYSVPTEVLNNKGGNADLTDSEVKTLGTKSSQSRGMMTDSSGLLYFGLYGSNSVNSWNTSYSALTDKNQALLIQNDIDLQTPDTFAVDRNGYAFVTTNRLNMFLANSYDFQTINFRVIRFFIGLKSYMYSKSDVVEPSPAAEPESEPEAEAEPKSEPEPEADSSSAAAVPKSANQIFGIADDVNTEAPSKSAEQIFGVETITQKTKSAEEIFGVPAPAITEKSKSAQEIFGVVAAPESKSEPEPEAEPKSEPEPEAEAEPKSEPEPVPVEEKAAKKKSALDIFGVSSAEPPVAEPESEPTPEGHDQHHHHHNDHDDNIQGDQPHQPHNTDIDDNRIETGRSTSSATTLVPLLALFIIPIVTLNL